MSHRKGLRLGVVVISIASLLFANLATAAPLPYAKGKQAAHPKVAINTQHIANKKDAFIPPASHLGEKADPVLSNAFNFKSLYSSSVDPRTGSLSFSYTIGHIVSNQGFGPNLTLKLLYNQGSHVNAYGLADGWSLNLTHYDLSSHMLSLSNGGSFRINDLGRVGLLSLQYAKLDVLKVYKGGATDPYYLKLLFKDGHVEYLNDAGYVVNLTSPRGDAIYFSYDTSTGGHVLTRIHDDQGHEILVQHVGSSVQLQSQGDVGQKLTTTLSLSNGRVMDLTLPDDHSQIRFTYALVANQQLIDGIYSPTGSWDSFHYTTLSGPSISGHAVSQMPAVSLHVSHPNVGTSHNDVSTTYNYNLIAGHNYLAHGASVPFVSNADLLFLAPQSYRYGTSVSNGRTVVSYTYNKFHLLMDQRTTTSSGTLLQDAVQCYAINETGGKVCGDETLALKLSSLPAFYTLPVEQRVTYYTPVNTGRGLLKGVSPSRTVVTQKTYDDQGNVLSSTDGSGRYSVTSYNPANQNGFINDKHEDRVYPTKPKSSALLAGVALKSALKPDPIKTTYQYLKLTPLDSQLKADLSLPKQIQESYLDAQGHWQVFRTKVSHYYGQEAEGLRHAKAGQDTSYGLLSQAQLSEPATAPDRLSGQLQQYHYHTQDTVKIQGKDYAVLEKQTAAYHDAPNPVGLSQSHPIMVSKYVSLYTGHELLAKDANGNENAYLYDALGRKTQAMANLGSQLEATKTYQYHMGSGHNEVIVTAPNGYQSKQVYDGLGRVIGKYVEHINSDGQGVLGQWDQVAANTYDQYGNKSSSTVYDSNGQGKVLSLTTYYQYDSQNRPTIESFPDGAAKVTVYDDAHHRTISYILASNGKALSQGTSPCRIGETYYQATIKNFTVVDRNNMTDKKHPQGKEIAHYLIASNPEGKDAQGKALYSGELKQALIDNEAFLAKGMVLDPSWLPTWIEQVIDQHAYYSRSMTTYDGFGRAIASEDVNGNLTQQVFDARGNVTQKILPNGNTQVMGYDVAGKLVQIGAIIHGKTQNLGKRYYNALGDLVWEQDPLGNRHQYQQDMNGNVTQITTPNGQVVHQQYDAMNKLIKRSVQGDTAGLYTTTWAYDGKTGKVIQRVDATGTTTFRYYPNGQIKGIAHSTESSKPGQVQLPYTLSYTYTLSGHPKSITDASGKTTSYHYNNLGQLTQVLYDGKRINDYGYDHYARLISQTYPNHLQTQYTYDEYNALATLVHQQLGQSTKLITKFAYTYNQDGNIQTRTRTNQQGEQAGERYTYDKDNNLTSYQCQGGLCPQDQRHNTINSQHYTFDAVNNIKSIQSSLTNSQGKVITNATTYHYSPVLPTRLIGYQNSNADYGNSPTLLYDKDGNMVQDDQHQLLTYDALDRTQAIHKAGQDTPLVTYLYNGDNIQIGEQSKDQDPTYFIYGQGKLTNTGQGNNTISYLYGGKQRLAKVENPNTTYYLTDQGQSVIHLVQTTKDNEPKVMASYAYSPYGIETTLSQANKDQATKRFGFDGQLTDPTTGWQFLGKGYRAYNPLLHRFMSQDSMSPFEKGGINGYVFASNNPIMKFDPSGHWSAAQWAGFGASFLTGLLGMVGGPFGAMLGGAVGGFAGSWVTQGVQTKNWVPTVEAGIQAGVGAGIGLGLSVVTGVVGAGVIKLRQFLRASGMSEVQSAGANITEEQMNNAVIVTRGEEGEMVYRWHRAEVSDVLSFGIKRIKAGEEAGSKTISDWGIFTAYPRLKSELGEYLPIYSDPDFNAWANNARRAELYRIRIEGLRVVRLGAIRNGDDRILQAALTHGGETSPNYTDNETLILDDVGPDRIEHVDKHEKRRLRIAF